jgi:hypothetical protein
MDDRIGLPPHDDQAEATVFDVGWVSSVTLDRFPESALVSALRRAIGGLGPSGASYACHAACPSVATER